MEENLKNESSSSSIPDTASSLRDGENVALRPNESHGMALNRPFGAEVSEEKISEQSSCEFHLTVKLKVSLTDRQCGLLLEVLNYQAVRFGITFNMYLAMWTLYSRLLGSNRRAHEVNEDFTKVTVMVTEIILQTFKDFAFPLSPGEMAHLPERVKEILKPGLMSHRTYGSRFVAWRPDRFLEVLTVPVGHQFLDTERFSQPYNSYCKGYGESHPSAHRHKTKFSAELDVDASAEDRLEELNLLVRSVHPKHKLSEVLRNEYDLFLKAKD
jgi:hypothetical protein